MINRYKLFLERVANRMMNESLLKEENGEDYYEEYEKDYPDGDFDPQSVDIDDLIRFCRNNDFLYIYDMPFGGWRISNANSDEIRDEIIRDIDGCGYIEPTHDMDYLLIGRQKMFIYDYISVIKVGNVSNGSDYYIIYMQDK